MTLIKQGMDFLPPTRSLFSPMLNLDKISKYIPKTLARVVLCSWARYLTFTLPLSTQVYKWVQVNLHVMVGGSPATDLYPIQGGDNCQPDGLHG